MKRLLIWGASGHAKQVAETTRRQGLLEVAAFLDDRHPERHGERFHGAPVIGDVAAARGLLAEGVAHVHVAIGHSATRLRLAALAQDWGFTLATVVHPQAIVSPTATIGMGCFVGAHSIIGADARIGENVILNDGVGIGHDCVIEDGGHLGPRVLLAGGVTVGYSAWLAMGVFVREQVRIGPEAVIGAASLVLEDVPGRVLAYGVPARAVRALADSPVAAP